MKIVYITAGTGNFYCGTCLRDHTLVNGLRRQGHDAILVPLYLPLVTDIPVDDEAPLFYGGINVFLQQRFGVFRKTPRWFDRFFDLKAFLRLASRYSSLTNSRDLGELTISTLNGINGHQAKELDRLITWLKTTEKPDIVCLSNVLLMGFAGPIREALDRPVICSLQGEDAFIDHLPTPYCEQTWELLRERVDHADAFIAVSRYYGGVMQKRLEIPDGKLHVVHNGISLDGFDSIEGDTSVPAVGYMAQMIPGKGLESLVDAFIELKMKDTIAQLTLRVAGSLVAADRSFVQGLRARIESSGFSRFAEFQFNIRREEKLSLLGKLSVLSVPALYGEAFGLYVIEALAAGVPVVQPRHASFPELLDLTHGGLLYDPDEPGAYVNALEVLLLDRSRARKLGEQGRGAVYKGFSEATMTSKFAEVLTSVVG